MAPDTLTAEDNPVEQQMGERPLVLERLDKVLFMLAFSSEEKWERSGSDDREFGKSDRREEEMEAALRNLRSSLYNSMKN